MEKITAAEKNKSALTYGIILAILCMVMSTGVNMQSGQFITFYVLKLLGYIVYLVVMAVLAARIRKANGGFIEFKEIFGAIFVMVIIANLLYYIYEFIYYKYIDPEFLDRMKNGTLTWMEKMKTPDDKIDAAARKFDQQMAESKNFNIGKNLLNYFWLVIGDSLFGLIIAAIIKRPKPVFDTY